MAMNQFMHPRNKYRKQPDFKALAIKYPEFRKYAKQDISGRVSLDFKEVEALRVLTRTLLLEDFGLDVDIPPGRLVPTIPLRLNYLLWIEDLLESNQRTSDVIGIDIGCGASCVYTLLAAKHFGWKMLATEVDMESTFIAGRNVNKNNLQDLIKVSNVKEYQMLEGVVEATTTYDFCLCNPPFFSSEEELDPKNVARTESRPPPRNAHSGTTNELVVPGGEIAFVTEIIRDSVKLKANVRIYTTMLGHKSSVGKVKQALQDVGVASSAIETTEFCQGRTTRWGVAWTLDPSISLPKLNTSQMKKKKPTAFCQTFKSDFKSTVDKLMKLLEELEITYKFLKSTKYLYAMEITAVEQTWTNQRKKKRKEKQQKAEGTENGGNSEEKVEENSKEKVGENGKEKVEENSKEKIEENNKEKVEEDSKEKVEENNPSKESNLKLVKENGTKTTMDESSSQKEVEENEIEMAEAEESAQSVVKGSKRSLEENDEVSSTSDSYPAKKPKIEESTASGSNAVKTPRRDPLFQGTLVVRSKKEESSVEITWLKGTGGRDAANQVLIYIKNAFEPL